MRVLLTILLVVLVIVSNAQTRPAGNPQQKTTFWHEFGYVQPDSGLINGRRDTLNFFPRFSGTQIYRPQDRNIYFYDSTLLRWFRLLKDGDVSSTTASNGLNKVVDDIRMGGNLTMNTTINGSGLYEMKGDSLLGLNINTIFPNNFLGAPYYIRNTILSNEDLQGISITSRTNDLSPDTVVYSNSFEVYPEGTQIVAFDAASDSINIFKHNATSTSVTGRVGIGNQSPGAWLDVNGTGRFLDTLKLPNILTKTDTTANKPVAIDVDGNIVKMDYWPINANTTAQNGLSKSGSDIVLGQDVSAVGNPGRLLSNREIPFNGFNLHLPGSSGSFKVGDNAGTSTARMQVSSTTAFSATPYQSLGPLLSNSIYSTLHTSDTVTVASEAAIPVRGYQMNRNLVMGANGNVNLTGKNGAALVDVLRVRDTVTMNASGHNNWYANSSQLSFLKAGGYSGRSSIRGGVDGISDAPSALTAELVIAGSSGANNFHFYGDWVSLVAELAHTASSQDTIDHYMSVWANANYLGRIQKAEYFRGFGLGTQTDSLWSFYFEEPNAVGYHQGRIGIGTRAPNFDLQIENSGATENIISTAALGTNSGGKLKISVKGLPGTAADVLGNVEFTSRNGANDDLVGAQFRAIAEGAWTATTNMPTAFVWRSVATSTMVEKMRLNSTGNLGIGITNPTGRVHPAAGTTTIPFFRTPLGVDMTTPLSGSWTFATLSGVDRLAFSPAGTTYNRFVFTNDVAPSNGQIPIGNGTNYTVANITGSSSVTVSNGSGTIGLSIPTSYLEGADYVPTLTGIANVDAVTLIDAHYTRINDQVSFDVMLSIDPTTISTNTNVDITLPIFATITNFTNLTGIITSGDGAIGNTVAVGNKARIGFVATSTSATTYNVHVAYKIP